MKKRVRLIDIAEKAGVSKMCVSLALRDDPSISEETKKNIREIATNMGYVPDRIAKGLSNGRTYTIAAIVGGDLHDDYHNQFLKGATDYAASKGYVLTIALTEGDVKLEKDIVKKYYEMSIDGYLIFHSGNEDICQFMSDNETPFVLYTKYFEDVECSYVVCDDVYGGEMMTEYLIEMGHKRIAYVYDQGLSQSSEVLNRMRGYKRKLENYGMEFDRELVVPYFYNYPAQHDEGISRNGILLSCLKAPNAPTAIFVCNDIIASSVLADLKAWGFHIPGDISIAGYEGIYLGTVLDPPLTTISSPIKDMGRKSCQVLIDKIEQKTAKDEVLKISMKPKLTVRKSVVQRGGEVNSIPEL